ncbi:MAG: glutamate--tRNA ligase, partial [Proteobacteria bacterium]|nr:glutamate--tRNA ligase [Pseudomonadota bacterium]
TYMLSVVVDDHDMEISHVIRGDDHLTNAFRQAELYRALGWAEPLFAHIPLIHGADGAKLSKRHGALGVATYRELGVLPEALCNTLLRLGWSHGDDEIIAREQAIEWFDLAHVGRGAARFDLDKLMNVNAHYLRRCDDATLARLITPLLAAKLGGDIGGEEIGRLARGMAGLKERAKTTVELAEVAAFYVARRPLSLNPKALKILTAEARGRITGVIGPLSAIGEWDRAALEAFIRAFADEAGIKLGGIAQPLRAALTGSNASPGIFEVMEVLGRDECVGRLADVARLPKSYGGQAGGPNA